VLPNPSGLNAFYNQTMVQHFRDFRDAATPQNDTDPE
jgi:hypothetical protein